MLVTSAESIVTQDWTVKLAQVQAEIHQLSEQRQELWRQRREAIAERPFMTLGWNTAYSKQIREIERRLKALFLRKRQLLVKERVSLVM